ncbi:polysaccharide deacetylase family protein [Kitasatospora sp. NPDC101801]|uniref:polysaccharide deacetylase family protein n=1 Tax=Kitasatospora sp. NPDC101801 TaxID=3364103 RepID=UPI003815F54F
MRYCGIAWTELGYELAVVDDRGLPVEPPVHVAAGRVPQLTAHLLGLRDRSRAAGQELATVVDSTNGMLDGGLMSAGLHLYRADPWSLPERPAFGSVAALTLAVTAARDPATVVRLQIESGTLTGRVDQLEAAIAESEDATEALRQAGRCLAHGSREHRVVALTFDDGPNPPYTGRILDVLDRYQVPATFFCVGLHALAHHEELSRMAAAGHQIANHTWSHPYLPDLSRTELADQLARTDDAVAQVVGAEGPRLFRPPYGSRTPEVLSWLADGGSTVALWDVEPFDWALPGADAITRSILEQTRPGSVILMHDGGGDRSQTAEALPGVIEGLLARGYSFARMDQLPTD